MDQFVDFITNHWLLSSLFSVILLALFVNEAIRKRFGIPEISPEAVVQWMNHHGAVVLDMRAEALFSEGHILGSEHATLSGLEKKAANISKNTQKPLVLVASASQEPGKIGKTLLENGVKHVMILSGGIEGWKAAGLPLVKS